jgi:hypothetical protein
VRPEELLELWEEMGTADSGATGLDRRLLDVEAPVSLYACIFWPSGRPGLLVEGEGEQKRAQGRIPKCRGVRLVHEVTSAVPRRTVLRVVLEDGRLRDIFAVLSADLVDTVRVEKSAAAALGRCIDRLSMWQGLFDRVPVEGLSDEAQRGLFGELAVLEDVVLDALGALEGVTAWTGPEPKNQDFVHEGVALEVKTSLAKRHARLMIANEKQLDERPHRLLLLVYVKLDESAAQGMTLPARVEHCRVLLRSDPVAGRIFDDRLMTGGYLDVHAPLYANSSWRVSGVRFFQVRDAFPRLTDANLPAGVGDVRYSIIADDLGSYELSRGDALSALGARGG